MNESSNFVSVLIASILRPRINLYSSGDNRIAWMVAYLVHVIYFNMVWTGHMDSGVLSY